MKDLLFSPLFLATLFFPCPIAKVFCFSQILLSEEHPKTSREKSPLTLQRRANKPSFTLKLWQDQEFNSLSIFPQAETCFIPFKILCSELHQRSGKRKKQEYNEYFTLPSYLLSFTRRKQQESKCLQNKSQLLLLEAQLNFTQLRKLIRSRKMLPMNINFLSPPPSSSVCILSWHKNSMFHMLALLPVHLLYPEVLLLLKQLPCPVQESLFHPLVLLDDSVASQASSFGSCTCDLSIWR